MSPMSNTSRPFSTRLVTALMVTLLTFAASLVLSACNPGPYGACTLPSSEALNDACAPQGGGENEAGGEIDTAASCVVDFVFECETQLCGTFQGSDPFCTEKCDGEGLPGCSENGVCLEWVPGTGQFYCVPADMAPPGFQPAT